MAAAEFSQLIQHDAGYLFPFALTLTRDQEDAKDLIQETLCRALYNSEKFISGTNIRGWMCTIMKNIFINDYRKKNREYSYAEQVIRDRENCREVQSIPQEGGLQLKEIENCVHILPEIFRFPLQMHFEGYKYKEIAKIMDEPLGTIKSRIHLAKKNLREMLEKYTS
jgi:RNA polymerase sigma-70 factor (ECF subfamily)